ncbi:molybdenum ABC transporter ATP-binding protein [Thalassospira mesophila]|uniref:Molybdenum ABC transporter ATPase n=1 Tax=Thalassospira mesophila TaxID=1293891 RepID=A0A1Y2L048_9PROT|nr:molybdenum ABC transporter ATP-binding protein [Thalassospira mesophila]OSQ38465.1 molybdenum ABC transporter ATPase [Thalassospira mesophila]
MNLEIDIRHQAGMLALDACFTIERPGITALFGPSGSGKTTLINAIAGLIRPDDGTITINGTAVFDRKNSIHLPPRQRRVGYVFQDARLFPHLTVRKNLYFAHRRSPNPLPNGEIDAIIAMLGIGGLLSRRPIKLSGGEKQRVSLGRALLGKPDILLLDEPLSALDQARKDEILPYLEALRDQRRLPILYVSHAIDEVARLADNMVVMENGTVRASGSVFDILARTDLAPLTGQFDTGAVIPATVTGHDTAGGITFLDCAGHQLIVPLLGPATPIAPAPATATRLRQTRLHIRARDVMIATTIPDGISANNIVPVTIRNLQPLDHAGMDVALHLGHLATDTANTQKHAPVIHARITGYSASRLNLQPGQQVYAVIKSVTVDGKLRDTDA